MLKIHHATSFFLGLNFMAKITAMNPVLASLDLARTVEFYICYLGFKKILCDSTLAIVARDGFGLQFWKCDDKYIAENTSVYIDVDDIQNLHAEFQKSGTPHLAALQKRSWGMTEMYVSDFDGNLLKLARRTA